jgi:hypothetical protein
MFGGNKMSLTGRATGQVVAHDKELFRVYRALMEERGDYKPSPIQPFSELDLSTGDLLTVLHNSGLRYTNDMSGGTLTKGARERLRKMSRNPRYHLGAEDEKAFAQMAESNSIGEILGLLTPLRLSLMIAFERDEGQGKRGGI